MACTTRSFPVDYSQGPGTHDRNDPVNKVCLFQRSSNGGTTDHFGGRGVANRCMIYCLNGLARFLVLSEMFATKLFEYVSRATNAPSSGVFPASESAVAIIGEDDGRLTFLYVRDKGRIGYTSVTETVDERTVELGCSLALGFSEAGYTVFTLYRMKSQGDIQGTSSAPSANVRRHDSPKRLYDILTFEISSFYMCGTRRRKDLDTLRGVWSPPLYWIPSQVRNALALRRRFTPIARTIPST